MVYLASRRTLVLVFSRSSLKTKATKEVGDSEKGAEKQASKAKELEQTAHYSLHVFVALF